MHECFALAFSAQSGYFDHFLENAYFITPLCGLERFFARHFAVVEPPAAPLSTQTKAGAQSALGLFERLLGRPICEIAGKRIAIPYPSSQGLELHVHPFVNYLRMNPNMFPF